MPERNPVVLIVAACLCAAIALLPVQGFACHRGTPHGQQTSCDDPPPPPPDDGGDTPTPIDTYAWWVNVSGIANAMLDTDPNGDGRPDRECTAENFQPNGSNGHYHCRHVAEYWDYPISIDLSGVVDWEQTERRGDPLLCRALQDGVSLVADGLYSYVWEGNCRDPGGCLIRISNWFNGRQVTDAVAAAEPAATPVDRLVLNALAQVQLGPDDDLNPFIMNRVVLPHSLNFDFFEVGRNKAAARCSFDMTTADPAAIFESITR